MDIEIPNNKLRKAIQDDARRVKTYGADMAKKIAIRMASLMAAETLADFWPPNQLPERCHELKGQLKGTFSIDLVHPYRILFRPFQIERSLDDDERIWWNKITHIEITDILDTHG
jgi:proteic killer suppression protein